ncbi:SDR family NAD(P)-dependent oxidoreductase [Rhodococcus sp. TAF43]|uniref:SDR family NAD(P)-dependent oxidoreductase n=1 Tax=unclassified Rhodococcus (in: high G+C Gram-positive bacteria) TaxID=192944 RepID=UPI000E0C28D1|nr:MULTISPECIES: SDR family NAD(P)-dependent oxidoreductase [unclassified Rhodococcus (in: high G+C Gram-positive bacteria)]QKT09435.1 SDR family oxidoreductase [Rhodococcus sp. W8901]RDI16418.1 NAD(P)-dependent dehydrogenase (short-subunit alcohol dehydrogenase family) [Rhodococcus sp. AG1013]
MDPLSRFRLDDRVVLITGASSGLGAGFARAVAAVGATVVLAARREDRLVALAEELRAQGSSVLTHATDVSSVDDCRALAAAAAAEFGRIDVLVNNAGLGGSTPALREDPDRFRAVVDVNLNGTFWMAQACAAVMNEGASIVNIASVHGLVASRFPQAAYAASKAGVLGLTRDLAQQWSRRKGIRVNALCPGYFASEMTAEGESALREMVADQSVLGRFGTQEELDSALLFLASDASSYMTGASLVVDGGMSAV